MSAGFLQYLTTDRYSATYNNGKTLTNSIQGETFIDKSDPEGPFSDHHSWSVFTDATPARTSKTIYFNDEGPGVDFPYDYYQGQNNQPSAINRLNLLLSLTTYVVVQTKGYYVTTAFAQANWALNAAGNVSVNGDTVDLIGAGKELSVSADKKVWTPVAGKRLYDETPLKPTAVQAMNSARWEFPKQ